MKENGNEKENENEGQGTEGISKGDVDSLLTETTCVTFQTDRNVSWISR